MICGAGTPNTRALTKKHDLKLCLVTFPQLFPYANYQIANLLQPCGECLAISWLGVVFFSFRRFRCNLTSSVYLVPSSIRQQKKKNRPTTDTMYFGVFCLFLENGSECPRRTAKLKPAGSPDCMPGCPSTRTCAVLFCLLFFCFCCFRSVKQIVRTRNVSPSWHLSLESSVPRRRVDLSGNFTLGFAFHQLEREDE